MNESSLFELHTETVRPEWIDYNGHMNVAYYLLAFDHATDALLEHLGLGQSYLKATNRSTFTLELHITYDKEVKESDPLRFTTQILDYDPKRIHYIHCMYHATEGYLAATNEVMTAHVDLEVRRIAPMPEDILDRLERIMQAHRVLPIPPQVGRKIGIRRR